MKEELSKKGHTDKIEEESRTFLDLCFHKLARKNRGDVDVEHLSDKKADIDELYTLLDIYGKTTGLTLTAQVKGVEKDFDGKYKCKRKFLNYCKRNNHVVLLIVVDLENEIAYWLHLSQEYLEKLENKLTVELPVENIVTTSDFSYFDEWVKICERDWKSKKKQQKQNVLQLSIGEVVETNALEKGTALVPVLQGISDKMLLFECILFLIYPTYINDDTVRQNIRKILDITEIEENYYIEQLIKNDVLYRVGDLIFFKDNSIGQALTIELLTKSLINLDFIYDSFDDLKIKIQIIKRLVKLRKTKVVKAFFQKLSINFLNHLSKFTSNEDIFSNLELLENYVYVVPETGLKITKQIINNKSPLAAVKHESHFGEFYGKSHQDLILKSLEILRRIRYIKSAEVLNTITGIYISTDSNNVKKKCEEIVKKMSEYDLYVMKHIGYGSQLKVLSFFKKLSTRRRKQLTQLILSASEQLLNGEYENIEAVDYKTMSLSRGSLEYLNGLRITDLEEIRNGIFDYLMRVFNESKELKTKLKVIDVIGHGITRPESGSKDYNALLTQNIEKVAKFYNEIVNNVELEVINKIEEQLYHLDRKDRNTATIKTLKVTLKNRADYQEFKQLIGYRTDSYDIENWDVNRKNRDAEVQNIIDTINEQNINNWKDKILKFAKNYTWEIYLDYEYFNKFLFELAKQKPQLMLQVVSDKATYLKLEPFMVHILTGLWQSSHLAQVKEFLSVLIKENHFLYICSVIPKYEAKKDLTLFDEMYLKAKQNNDERTIVNLLKSLLKSFTPSLGDELRKRFMDIVGTLNKLGNIEWASHTSYRDVNPVLEILSESETDKLLEYLIKVPEIDFYGEHILLEIGKRFPTKVVEHLYKRVEYSKEIKLFENRYDAIPHRLDHLQKLFRGNKEIMISQVFSWYDKGDSLLDWEASHLINKVFVFEPALQNEIFRYIHKKTEKSARVVFSILNAFEGDKILIGIIDEFIKVYQNLPKYKKYKESLFIHLSQTGGVWGEYGFVNALTAKKESLKDWKTEDEAVQGFKNEYGKYLDERIENEKKRADEDVEQMKRGFED